MGRFPAARRVSVSGTIRAVPGSSKLGLRAIAAVLAAGCAALAACGSSSDGTAAPPFLDPSDINRAGADESPFDPVTSLVVPSDFTDPSAVRDIATVQRFFERTPYGRRSFLETYSSNGVSAAGAVLAAAVKYRINPIVLLVRMQMSQGLVGLATYPEPSTRVEYVFECGCDGRGNCIPEMAGLDRQVECLAARLRSYLTQISESPDQVTYGGWGPDLPAITLDGVTVTPPDESSSALYQLDPVYGEKGKRGAWLFYRMYLSYSRSFGYSGSIDPELSGGWIGEGCSKDSDCSSAITNVRCLTDSPGGYCSAPCADDGCPSSQQKPAAYCADLQQLGGGCVAYCNPAAPNCRDGYVCAKVTLFGSNGQQIDACTKPAQ